MKAKWLFSLLVVTALFSISSRAAASPQYATPAGTAFTYQGRLSDGGTPAIGAYDFTFKLFDADVAGAQVGGPIALEDVVVTDGLFTVQLDFGVVYDGSARFLEVGVRPGASTGGFTILTPRERLNPTPYALNAFTAPWSGLTGIPAGFADGIDNGATYTNGNGLQLIGTEFSVLFGGSGSANTAARSDHDHWGASWYGSETGLTLGGGNIGLYGDGGSYGVYGSSPYAGGVGLYGTGNSSGVVGDASTSGGAGITGNAYLNSGNYAGLFNGNVKVNGNQSVVASGITFSASGGTTGIWAGGSTYGVNAQGKTAVYALSTGTNGEGVGVYASGMGGGVMGLSTLNGAGVYGWGPNGVLGAASCAGCTGVVGRSYTGAGDYAGEFIGNVVIAGNLTAQGTKSAVVKTQTFGERLLYAVESPENWFEDFGSGQLVGGKAVVTIDPVFAQTVNLNDDYHIFLTPYGACALYVQAKTPTSFTVGAFGQPGCSVGFDYRIVARRLGYEDLRLEVSGPAAVPAAPPTARDER